MHRINFDIQAEQAPCCKQSFAVSNTSSPPPPPPPYIAAICPPHYSRQYLHASQHVACCCLQAPEHLHSYQAGGKLDTFDIEELVAEGSKGCALLSPSRVQLACHCGLYGLAPRQDIGCTAAFTWQLLSCCQTVATVLGIVHQSQAM